MKKTVFFLIFVFIISACSHEEYLNDINDINEPISLKQSNFISKDEAQEDLKSLLIDLDVNSSRMLEGKSIRTIANSYSIKVDNNNSRTDNSESLIHIFNFANNQGFAIMSSDRRLPSLIAISDSGNINEGDTIFDSGFGLFYSDLPDLILKPSIDNNPELGGEISGSRTEYGEWETTVYHQGGLCPVTWGQGTYYNNFCPIIDNQNTKTGCVATAVAQLMSVFQYPQSYNGYDFYWNQMITSPFIYYVNNESKEQIARLMQQLGLKNNLDMNYGVDGSGASINNIPRTMEAFGYTHPGAKAGHTGETASNIFEELKNGYPVILSGFSYKKCETVLGIHIYNSYSNGHAWLVHGLLERSRNVKTIIGDREINTTETYYYYLCNWGWSGEKDGYYLYTVFNTENGPVFDRNTSSSRAEDDMEGDPYNYQYKIEAVLYFRP